MKDPFNPGIAIGKIQLLGPAGDRNELINGDWLPMKNVDGYMIRAQQRRVVGRNQKAIDDYDKALEIAPENGDLYFCKGQTYIAMEKKRMRSQLVSASAQHLALRWGICQSALASGLAFGLLIMLVLNARTR